MSSIRWGTLPLCITNLFWPQQNLYQLKFLTNQPSDQTKHQVWISYCFLLGGLVRFVINLSWKLPKFVCFGLSYPFFPMLITQLPQSQICVYWTLRFLNLKASVSNLENCPVRTKKSSSRLPTHVTLIISQISLLILYFF